MTRLESHAPVVDRPAGLVRENEERLRELLWNSQILQTRLESYAPVVHRPAGLVRIQKICSFLNLILRKILRSFHIVYSYVHCCLLLISPKIIELRNFLARDIVHVLHSFFGVSTQFLHDDFTAGNDHFSSRLSDLREILLKFIHILLILLLFFSC